MDKRILIGGGVSVAAILALIVIRKRSTASNASSDTQSSGPQMGSSDGIFYSGLAPSSGGLSSPSDPGNSGSTATGGGFDIGALLGSLLTNKATTDSASIRSQADNIDSSILASIIGANGTANIVHNANGSTITNVTQIPTPAPAAAPIILAPTPAPIVINSQAQPANIPIYYSTGQNSTPVYSGGGGGGGGIGSVRIV